MGDILGDLEFDCRNQDSVQVVEDVTSKVVEELAVVLLLEEDPICVVNAIGFSIAIEVEHAACKRVSISAHM